MEANTHELNEVVIATNKSNFNIFDVQELPSAYKKNEVDKYKKLLEKFSNIPHQEFMVDEKGKNNMIEIYYEILLHKPRSIDEFEYGVIKKSIILTKGSHTILLPILLNSKFYSNFKNILLINFDEAENRNESEGLYFVIKYVKDILGVKFAEGLDVESFEKITEKSLFENIIKFLIEYGNEVILKKRSLQNFITKRFQSDFLWLLSATLKGNKQKFERLFNDFTKKGKDEIWLMADVNVLLTVAYFMKQREIVLTIIKSESVDVNKLEIVLEKKKFVLTIAEHGYFDLLDAVLSKVDIKKLPEILIECIKGKHYSIGSSSSNVICVQDHDKCIEKLINDENFELKKEVLEAVCEYGNSAMVSKFLNKAEKTIDSLLLKFKNKGCLKGVLDSFVSKEKKSININLKFLNVVDMIEDMEEMAKNDELKDLLSHPVLLSYIEYKLDNFCLIYEIDLLTYMLFFIGLLFFGLYYELWYFVFAAGIYLIIRETLQYCCHSTRLHDEVGGCYIFLSFYYNRGNFLGLILIISTISWAIHLYLGEEDYKLSKFLTLFIASKQLFELSSEVSLSFAKKLLMYQTVIKSIIQTSSICIFIIITDGICLWGLIYLPKEIERDYNISTFLLLSISLVNFAIGLVISDVQKVEAEAELEYVKLKIVKIKRNSSLMRKFAQNEHEDSCIIEMIKCCIPNTENNFQESDDVDDDAQRLVTFIVKKNQTDEMNQNQTDSDLWNEDEADEINIKFKVTESTFSKLKYILKQREQLKEQENIGENVKILKSECSQLRENFKQYTEKLDRILLNEDASNDKGIEKTKRMSTTGFQQSNSSMDKLSQQINGIEDEMSEIKSMLLKIINEQKSD